MSIPKIPIAQITPFKDRNTNPITMVARRRLDLIAELIGLPELVGWVSNGYRHRKRKYVWGRQLASWVLHHDGYGPHEIAGALNYTNKNGPAHDVVIHGREKVNQVIANVKWMTSAEIRDAREGGKDKKLLEQFDQIAYLYNWSRRQKEKEETLIADRVSKLISL
jgi:hypothetical protein